MVSTSALSGLVVSAVLATACPIVAVLVCRRRMTLSLRNVTLGAAVFVIFSLMLERALTTYLLLDNPDTGAWLSDHRMAYVGYGIAAASLFEEIGRFLAMRLFVKPTGNPGTAAAYGIGHGAAEVLIVGTLTFVQTFSLALMVNAGTFESKLSGLPPAVLDRMRENLEHLTFLAALPGGFERAVAFIFQLCFSVLVWRAVETKNLWWLAAAVMTHALIDLPAACYQVGLLAPNLAEGFYLVSGTGALLFLLRRLPSRIDGKNPTAAPLTDSLEELR